MPGEAAGLAERRRQEWGEMGTGTWPITVVKRACSGSGAPTGGQARTRPRD